MPTRLADGLGLGSALHEASSTIRPCSVFRGTMVPPCCSFVHKFKDAMNNFGRQIVNEKNINSRPRDCQFSIQHLGALHVWGMKPSDVGSRSGGVCALRRHKKQKD